MSLYYRLKRRLGYDTVEKDSKTMTKSKYKVTHLNGEESFQWADGYTKTRGGFAEFWSYSHNKVNTYSYSEGRVLWIFGEFHPTKKQVRVLEGIQEIEIVDTVDVEYTLTYDRADDKFINLETEGRPHE